MADPSTILPYTPSPTSLPPNRRYILSHNPAGKSVIHSSPPQLYHGRAGVGGMARSYATACLPAVLAGDRDVAEYLDEGNKRTGFKGTEIVVGPEEGGKGEGEGGANLVVVDIAPGGVSQMHRTISIDFSICVLGVVQMELDGGELITLNPGDHVIQRGTMHKWMNASKTEPARFVAVTLPCVPFEIGQTGRLLVEEHLEGTGKAGGDGATL